MTKPDKLPDALQLIQVAKNVFTEDDGKINTWGNHKEAWLCQTTNKFILHVMVKIGNHCVIVLSTRNENKYG